MIRIDESKIEREAVEDALDLLKSVFVRCRRSKKPEEFMLACDIHRMASDKNSRVHSNPLPLNEGIFILPASLEVVQLCRRAIALGLVR